MALDLQFRTSPWICAFTNDIPVISDNGNDNVSGDLHLTLSRQGGKWLRG